MRRRENKRVILPTFNIFITIIRAQGLEKGRRKYLQVKSLICCIWPYANKVDAAFVNSGAYLQPEKLEKFQSIICLREDKIGLSPSTSDGILMYVEVVGVIGGGSEG